MNAHVVVVHADEQPEITEWAASIFLAGPMPRDISVPSWRPAMLEAITNAWTGPGSLAVFVPEARSWHPLKYDHHHWEDRWLSVVDVIVFWVPRDMQRLPGMNTNIEFGRWENSGRFVFGAPPSAAGVGYLRECATRQGAPVADSIEQTVADALAMIDGGQPRTHGNRDVPLLLWRSKQFQEWLETQIREGKRLAAGRVLWIHDIGTDGCPRYWAFEAQFEGNDSAQIIVSTPLPPDPVFIGPGEQEP